MRAPCFLLLVLVASVLTSGIEANAHAATPQPAAVTSDRPAARDAAEVQAADDALTSSGYDGLRLHLAALQEVLQRAPAVFPQIEQQGDVLIIRSTRQNDLPAALLVLMAASHNTREARWAYNTYPRASLLLGAYANEVHQPQDAIAYFDKGLALQPDDADLIREKGQALFQLRRWEEALYLYEGWLTRDDPTHRPLDRAILLRARGFALTELQRLDAAEAAYRESLTIEPDHGGAKYELNYIAQLRAGGPRQAPGMLTYEKAKARKP